MGVVLNWNWLAIVGAMPPTLLVILMFFMPETPRWLLAHNRRHEALKSLQWLRGPFADIEEECSEIELNLGKCYVEFILFSLTTILFYLLTPLALPRTCLKCLYCFFIFLKIRTFSNIKF